PAGFGVDAVAGVPGGGAGVGVRSLFVMTFAGSPIAFRRSSSLRATSASDCAAALAAYTPTSTTARVRRTDIPLSLSDRTNTEISEPEPALVRPLPEPRRERL